jgi:hypothetical protein
LRKHIKVEPEEFYYQCDKLGMIVFQDMVNNGDYSFIRDTALPTVGIVKWPDRNMHRDEQTRQQFLSCMEQTVNQLYSHPSIVYWTIFNEGWGQFDSTKVYRMLKELDPTRFIDTASGWFRCGESDLDSRHIYFRKIQVKPAKKPIVISEFGGYTYSAEGHIFNTEKEYGYGACETREAFVEKIRALYLNEIVPAAKNGACGSIYTQVSDVEDEVNGLFTYDREVEKLKKEEFADIAELLQEAIQE